MDPEKIKKNRKSYYTKNKHRWKIYNKRNPKNRKRLWKLYYEKNKSKICLKTRLYNKNNREKVKFNLQKWRLKNREKTNAQARMYWQKIKDDPLRKKRVKQWKTKNTDRINSYKRMYHSKKRLDPKYKITFILRNRMYRFISKKTNRASSFEDTIGGSYSTVISHIEKLFLPGMSWKNHGNKGWHIDHKRPISSFDLTNPIHQKECFHYTNLQPLWAKDNLTKNAKINWIMTK